MPCPLKDLTTSVTLPGMKWLLRRVCGIYLSNLDSVTSIEFGILQSDKCEKHQQNTRTYLCCLTYTQVLNYKESLSVTGYQFPHQHIKSFLIKSYVN